MGDLGPDSLHVYYCDFAYSPRGPFRMATSASSIADASAKTFAELLSGPLVDVYVGEAKRHWALHRNLLCHHSSFFQQHVGDEALKRSAKIDLLDSDPTAFELLVKWLYQGRIDDVSAMPDNKKWDYAHACQKLYVLCDQINLPQLKNFAIDQFRKGCNEAGLVPGPEEMKPIYQTTLPGSPFRKLVSKIAARQIMDPESTNDAGTYRLCFEGAPDFAIDVINAIRQGAGGKLFEDPTEGAACAYHEHENGASCPSMNGNGKKRVSWKDE